MRKEIRIGGFGGQGIVLAGVILGEASSRAGFHAVQTQSYGPEARGGAARSEVVISDSMIDYPKVVVPDVLVALSQPAFDKYISDVKGDTRVIVDADLVNTDRKGIQAIPFLQSAETAGKKIAANIVMLGFLAATLELVPHDVLEQVIIERIPKGTEMLNRTAFQAGLALGVQS